MKTNMKSLETKLLKKRAELVAALRAEIRDTIDTPEAVPEEDLAANARDEFIEARVNEFDHQELHLVDEALERVSQGVYGKCEDCGDAIELERLKALPWASRCIDCERQATLAPVIQPRVGDRLAQS